MFPRGEDRTRGFSHFQNSLPRPRRMGPYAASLPLSPCGGMWGRGAFFQGGEEGAAAAVGGGSWVRMENEGEAGASSPKARRRKAAEHVILGDDRLFLPGSWESESTWPRCWQAGMDSGEDGIGRCPRYGWNPSSCLNTLPRGQVGERVLGC